MGYEWSFVLGRDSYRLRLASGRPGPEGAERCDVRMAHEELRRWLDREPRGGRLAAEIQAALEPGAVRRGPDAARARRMVRTALESGRLELFRTRLPDVAPRERGRPAPPVAPRDKVAPKAELTWVEIELVNEDGEPMSGVAYRVDPADGSPPRTGRLDAHGMAHVAGVVAGKCTITFPYLDQRAVEPVDSTPRALVPGP